MSVEKCPNPRAIYSWNLLSLKTLNYLIELYHKLQKYTQRISLTLNSLELNTITLLIFHFQDWIKFIYIQYNPKLVQSWNFQKQNENKQNFLKSNAYFAFLFRFLTRFLFNRLTLIFSFWLCCIMDLRVIFLEFKGKHKIFLHIFPDWTLQRQRKRSWILSSVE